jgi:hypothetical protein
MTEDRQDQGGDLLIDTNPLPMRPDFGIKSPRISYAPDASSQLVATCTSPAKSGSLHFFRTIYFCIS